MVKVPEVGSRWKAEWSVGRPDALVWIVRGATELGIYITCPESRSPHGHLLTPAMFARDYRPAA